MKKVVVLIIIFFCLSTHNISAQRIGSICIQKLNSPKGDFEADWFLRIGKRERIPLSYQDNTFIGHLSLTEIHTIKIYQGSFVITSFKFKFGTYKTFKLCLRMNNLYETWQFDAIKSSKTCSCK
ncbi:MAG: hypothetical protein ACR2N3_11610 [Pyrinomonadaceae bacterium]